MVLMSGEFWRIWIGSWGMKDAKRGIGEWRMGDR